MTRWTAMGALLCLVGCGDTFEHSLPPWPKELGAVALGDQGGQPISGLPRYLPPRSPLVLDLAEDREVVLEVQALAPRIEREHDLAVCGVALSGPLPLGRRIIGVWRSAPFVPGVSPPTFAQAEESSAAPLTTAIDCEADVDYCSRVVVSSAGSIGNGTFLVMARLDPEVVVALFDNEDTQTRELYRYRGDTLVPAPDLDVNPDPNRTIVTMLAPNGVVLVLYADGQIWAVAGPGQVETYPRVPGAQMLVMADNLLYAAGATGLYLVDSSTISRLGDVPTGLLRLRGADDGQLYGIGDDGIQVWKGGAWALELASSELARHNGSFATDDALVYYFSGTAMLRRSSEGRWDAETTPDTGVSLNGGVISTIGQMVFGDTGGVFFRPAANEAWCPLMSGTSQTIYSGAKFGTGFVVGSQSNNGTATVIRIQPPE